MSIKKEIQDRQEIADQIYIECECGTHLLMVQNMIEKFDGCNYIDDEGNKHPYGYVLQEYQLAMFKHGCGKRSWKDRIVVAWRYLTKGTFHTDQLLLKPTEAQKLVDFINATKL
jgi:hypothetical protein